MNSWQKRSQWESSSHEQNLVKPGNDPDFRQTIVLAISTIVDQVQSYGSASEFFDSHSFSTI